MRYSILRQDIAEYSALKLRPSSRGVLRGELELRLARPRAKTRPEKRPARSVALTGSAVDADLFERLRELRREIAAEHGVPAYVVFSDRTLAEMAAARPSTPEEFLQVHGVGEAKLERFGGTFLEAIAEGA